MPITFKDKTRADEKAEHTLESIWSFRRGSQRRNWELDVFLSWLVMECYTTYMPNFIMRLWSLENPYLRPLQNTPFCPISASGSNFNPQNTQSILVVKIFVFLELEQKWAFCKGLNLMRIYEELASRSGNFLLHAGWESAQKMCIDAQKTMQWF